MLYIHILHIYIYIYTKTFGPRFARPRFFPGPGSQLPIWRGSEWHRHDLRHPGIPRDTMKISNTLKSRFCMAHVWVIWKVTLLNMHVLQGHPILADCLRRVSQNQSPATGPIKSISQKVYSAPCFSIPGHHLRTNSATETSPGSHCGHVWAPCWETSRFVTNPNENRSPFGAPFWP